MRLEGCVGRRGKERDTVQFRAGKTLSRDLNASDNKSTSTVIWGVPHQFDHGVRLCSSLSCGVMSTRKLMDVQQNRKWWNAPTTA